MMDASVIVPVRNERYVYNTLKGLLESEFDGEFEVLVIDDFGSDEMYSKELKEFCDKFEKIRYIKSAVAPGLNVNRNLGAKEAKSENCLIIDGDTVPSKQWIKEMVKSLKEYDIVEGNTLYEKERPDPMERTISGKSEIQGFLGANLGIKKKVILEIKFEERIIIFRGDTDFGLRALKAGHRAIYNPEAKITHVARRFTFKSFMRERLRYIYEPLLMKNNWKNPLLKKHVSFIWRVVYPVELGYLVLLIGSLFFSYWYITFPVLYLFAGFRYIFKFRKKRNWAFKLGDYLQILILVPLTILVKRYAMWKGAIKFKFFVI
ncbi:glycosyltransferase [Candidatus Woesearchaeota archaeon]|nr:glycosyltransferase [Candidatus Woesearchaeota archaeon]